LNQGSLLSRWSVQENKKIIPGLEVTAIFFYHPGIREDYTAPLNNRSTLKAYFLKVICDVNENNSIKDFGPRVYHVFKRGRMEEGALSSPNCAYGEERGCAGRV